jgi:hypothetical protein
LTTHQETTKIQSDTLSILTYCWYICQPLQLYGAFSVK